MDGVLNFKKQIKLYTNTVTAGFAASLAFQVFQIRINLLELLKIKRSQLLHVLLKPFEPQVTSLVDITCYKTVTLNICLIRLSWVNLGDVAKCLKCHNNLPKKGKKVKI